ARGPVEATRFLGPEEPAQPGTGTVTGRHPTGALGRAVIRRTATPDQGQGDQRADPPPAGDAGYLPGLRSERRSLPMANATVCWAWILIGSPVCGWRPARSGRRRF